MKKRTGIWPVDLSVTAPFIYLFFHDDQSFPV